MLQKGDKVLCRFFNDRIDKFYGDCFEATIESINKQGFSTKEWEYNVRRESGSQETLARKEIKRKVK